MKVKIKTWKKMKQQFGVFEDNNEEVIDCKNSFTLEMEKALPKNRIINIDNMYWNNFIYSEDMIEKYYNYFSIERARDLNKNIAMFSFHYDNNLAYDNFKKDNMDNDVAKMIIEHENIMKQVRDFNKKWKMIDD